MARGGCGGCDDEHPLRVARRLYDERMARWTAAQAALLGEVATTAGLPPPLAKRLAEEREARSAVLEAQEALQLLLIGRR